VRSAPKDATARDTMESNGVATFSRSGLATVAGTTTTPKSSVTVTGVALSASSLILATPQGTVSGAALSDGRDRAPDNRASCVDAVQQLLADK
jgi:hypothetical protein